jgi:hypothetical protein
LGLSVEVGDKTNVAHFLEGLAAVAASKGALVRAARLWRGYGPPMMDVQRIEFSELEPAAR